MWRLVTRWRGATRFGPPWPPVEKDASASRSNSPLDSHARGFDSPKSRSGTNTAGTAKAKKSAGATASARFGASFGTDYCGDEWSQAAEDFRKNLTCVAPYLLMKVSSLRRPGPRRRHSTEDTIDDDDDCDQNAGGQSRVLARNQRQQSGPLANRPSRPPNLRTIRHVPGNRTSPDAIARSTA